MMTCALVGNPNCGKTTLFNALTGSNQYVGNWAGVTVEKKIGTTRKNEFNIVDLPGIYSLSPYSLEERISRDYVIDEAPDAIINIIDGTNIERNLYLTVSLIELGKPMVLVVNMMDDVVAKGDSIDCCYLSKLLGIPVVPISARRNDNLDAVIAQVINVCEHKIIPPEINFNNTTQNTLNKIVSLIYNKDKPYEPYAFFASKLLEGDSYAYERIMPNKQMAEQIENAVSEYVSKFKYGDRETLLADARYTFIEEVVQKCVNKGKEDNSLSVSDKIDSVVTNRWLAIPIFVLIMFLMFSLTFGTVGTYLSGLIEVFFADAASPFARSILDNAQAPVWTYSLIIDAILNGVGGILTFLPQIALLFLCLSILEDSGYMARAAFITDRFLRKLGLSGKSFIPMIMGFGCTTPAVMATRTQENIKERRMTILLIPFMSCGAKLPIYALFASAFFERYVGVVVFSMYIIGFICSILVGLVLKKTLFKENMAPFIMELPSYRLPMPISVLRNTWDKCKGFIIKAGTIIFAMSIVIWLLQSISIDFKFTTDSTESIFCALGMLIAPLLIPLGFGTWQAAVSLLSGLIAKEAVVSTMLVLYSAANEAELSGLITNAFTPLSAFCFMVFCLLYVPCISAFVTIKKEMGSMRWALFSAGLQIGVAYVVSLIIYQIGSLVMRVI